MPISCPTDGQAEILIKDNIPLEYIKGIVTGTEEIAKLVYAMLKIYGMEKISLYIAPDVISTNWSKMIKEGLLPIETRYKCLEEN